MILACVLELHCSYTAPVAVCLDAMLQLSGGHLAGKTYLPCLACLGLLESICSRCLLTCMASQSCRRQHCQLKLWQHYCQLELCRNMCPHTMQPTALLSTGSLLKSPPRYLMRSKLSQLCAFLCCVCGNSACSSHIISACTLCGLRALATTVHLGNIAVLSSSGTATLQLCLTSLSPLLLQLQLYLPVLVFLQLLLVLS